MSTGSFCGHQAPCFFNHLGKNTHNDEFARLWAEGDVKVNGRGRKAMRHPDVGAIAVHFEVLMPRRDADQRLMSCRAADNETQAALDRLCTR